MKSFNDNDLQRLNGYLVSIHTLMDAMLAIIDEKFTLNHPISRTIKTLYKKVTDVEIKIQTEILANSIDKRILGKHKNPMP